MKYKIFSFLFFCLAIGLQLYPLCIYSQSKNDSLTHYYNLVLNPKSSEDLPKAIHFYSKKRETDNTANDTLNLLHDLRMIAIAEYKIGNIYDSEAAAVEAITLIDGSPKLDTLIQARIAILNQLGKIYRTEKKYEKAIEVYNDALLLHPKSKDSITIINNKGNIYKDQQKYVEALNQFSILQNNKNLINDSLQLARVLDNLGNIQSKLGMQEALQNLTKALQIRENHNDLDETYSSYKNLALYYFDQKDKEQALRFANTAYVTAKTLNSITYLQDALSLFAIMNEDPKIVQFKKITDSIANQNQLAENKNAFIKYNVANEKKKTGEALLEKEKEKNQKLIFIIIGSVIFLSSIYLYQTQKRKHKKEKIIQVHTTESRISKKVHDEVANDVYQLMAKIQGNISDKEKLLDDLEKIYNKTRDISKENSAIEIDANFSQQLNDLLLNYQNEKVSIATRNISKIEWEGISEIKKTTIFRVLQELMTNMKKYSEASVVVLTFQQESKKINIEYTDNGIGCTLKNKNGLQNAENRIHAINGTITFDSEPEKGFKSKISI